MSRRAPVLAGVVMVAVSLVAFFLLVFPKFREVGRAKADLRQAQAEEVALETELARLQEAKADAPQLMKQLARVRRQIPPAADLPGIINLLQDAADVSQVDFFAVSPAVPAVTPGGDASRLPATIDVVGGFFQVDEFLFRVETLQRAAKVLTVNVAPGPDELPQVRVTLGLNFYTTDSTAGPGAPVRTAPAGAAATAASPAPSSEGA